MSKCRIDLRTRMTIDERGGAHQETSGYCPRRQRSTALESCRGCAHCVELTPGGERPHMICHGPSAEAAPRLRAPRPGDLPRLPLTQLVGPRVTCVSADMEVRGARTLLLEQGLSALPIVDEQGYPEGILTLRDLLVPERLEPGARVRELMTPVAFTLPERSPLSYAAALMAVEGIDHVPVVDEEGKVVGLVTAHDLVRWMARSDGYVVPT